MAFIFSTGEGFTSQPLVSLAENVASLVKEEAKVEVVAKAYDSEECKTYLSRDLTRYGLRPVQITFQNNSQKTYKISPAEIDLAFVDPSDVTWKVTKGAIPRGIAFKLAGLLFWPFMIPSTIDSIHTYKTHKSLKGEYEAKALKDELLAPFSTLQRIVFVPEEQFRSAFMLSLCEKNSEEIHRIQVEIK